MLSREGGREGGLSHASHTADTAETSGVDADGGDAISAGQSNGGEAHGGGGGTAVLVLLLLLLSCGGVGLARRVPPSAWPLPWKQRTWRKVDTTAPVVAAALAPTDDTDQEPLAPAATSLPAAAAVRTEDGHQACDRVSAATAAAGRRPRSKGLKDPLAVAAEVVRAAAMLPTRPTRPTATRPAGGGASAGYVRTQTADLD